METTNTTSGSASERVTAVVGGTKDGLGAGDHDVPFAGFRPTHFSTRQLALLLILRGRVLDGKLGEGSLWDDLYPAGGQGYARLSAALMELKEAA